MATSVGSINFGVGIDASGIAAALERHLAPALAIAQRKLDQNPLKVKIDVDSSALAGVETALRNIRDTTIKVKVDLDMSAAELERLKSIAPALRSLKNLTDKTIKVKVTFDMSQAELDRLKQVAPALRSLRNLSDKNVRIRVNLDMSQAELERLKEIAPALRSLRGLSDKNITIKIDLDVDEARLARIAALLNSLPRSRDIDVRTNADRAGSDIDRLGRSLRRVGLTVAILAGVPAAIAAIGGAAGAALGLVGGLAVGLAALGPAVAAIGATVAVGFEGIGGAFTALGDLSSNAAADARTQTEAVASAQDALTSATDSAESAVVSLADAHENAADAAKGVADAYKSAEERLKNYQVTLREANLDEKEARLDLVEAERALEQTSFDPTERARALFRVERAEINLGKAQKKNTDLQAEARDAAEKGLDQSDEVLAAKKNQEKADRAVIEAQKNLVRSNEAVAKATEQLAKAQSGAGTSSEKFADALARLSPNAQAFVLAVRDLQPAFEALRKGNQDTLFANLGAELKQTADEVLPHLAEGMGLVATELNGAAVNALQFFRSAQGIEGLNASFASGANLLKGLRSGTGEFTQGLVDLTTTAEPAMQGLGRAIASIGEGIGRAFSEAKQSGELASLFDGLNGALTGFGDGLGDVVSGLITIGVDVLPSLKPFFETFGLAIKDIAPSLGEFGAVFVNALTSILPSLGELIKALAEGLKPVLPVLSLLIKSLSAAIIPLIEPFSKVATVIGETLVQTLDALAPALGPLVTAFADLLSAVAPIVPLFAKSLSAAVIALAPALSDVFKALAPVIKSLAEQLGPVIEEVAPALGEMAKTLGTALVDAITELAPILPPLVTAWTDLLLAVVPILPELVKLAVQILPPLVSVLVDLAPVLVKIIDAFTWLVNNVIIPYVIPALEMMAATWTDTFDTIADTVHFVTDTVFPGIQSALDKVQGWFSAAVEGIGKKWAELTDKAAIPVNFVIETVWNNGLLKAWGSIDNLLGGVLPDAQPLTPIPRRAAGGPLSYLHGGSGNGTKDDMLFWGSNNEHVVTSAEVIAAGGQQVLFAIRDMIARGIPFTWDHGKIITDLGRDNLVRYGAAVSSAGIGNVDPQGLFDQLANVPIPKFGTGGPITGDKLLIEPWMRQLAKAHEFAKAQNGKPYQWAGPTGPGSSFDCSGFMGSIAAVILDQNPWQRYWATSSFHGYPNVGPQGFTRGVDGGFVIGVTDDPGGPGGGHTAGVLGPVLDFPVARVESGGSLGDVHYNKGTDPNSFASVYHLPIGANGFFQPGAGTGLIGPSTGSQIDFLTKVVERVVNAATTPVREAITNVIGSPPPSVRGLPKGVLDGNEKAFVAFMSNAVGNLGNLLSGAWQKATDLGDRVLDFANPFDSGGIASGTGFMPKNVIAPERILSPEQTQLFEALVMALQKIATSSLTGASTAADNVIVDISAASVDALRVTLGLNDKPPTEDTTSPEFLALSEQLAKGQLETGELLSDTRALLDRNASSQELAAAADSKAQMDMLLSIAGKLSGEILGPIMTSAVDAGIQVMNGWIEGLSKDVVTAVHGTTKAVAGLDMGLAELQSAEAGGTAAFGLPGSSFDLASALSTAVVSIASAAGQAFQKVANDVINAALAQTPSPAGGKSKGRLGTDISGGFLVDTLVKLTGVEIEILDTLENTLDEIRAFRGDSFSSFTDTGELISDTAVLIQRNQSSIELAAREQERIQKALIKAVIKYLIVSVLIPIITAILSAMITLATTAIGAAIGSVIPIIGTAIGAAIGALIGAALGGLAAVFTGLLAIGAGAALDAFDSGGVASGVGMMPKNTIAPERVLSPRQTASFEQLVQVLDRGTGGNRTVQIGSMNINGRDPAQKTSDSLLALLNN